MKGASVELDQPPSPFRLEFDPRFAGGRGFDAYPGIERLS